ncbi:MAG: NAD(P)H-dependent oxidoreductase [Spirochaetaceae bacterium]|nr:NAD(P)H-dependent oxidoreductase [Spirochaetaceae bacterium]
MKTLIIFGHSNWAESRVSANWLKEFTADGSFTIHKLSEQLVNGRYNIEAERKIVEAHDRIVMVFPVIWFGAPAIVQQWLEEVFLYGWAYSADYGPAALKGKDFVLALTAGGAAEGYRIAGMGRNSYPLESYYINWQATASMTGMNFHPMYCLYATMTKQPADFTAAAQKLIGYLKADHLPPVGAL